MGRGRRYQQEKHPKGRQGICKPLNRAQNGMPKCEAEQLHVRMDPKGDALPRDLEAGLTNAESLLSLFFSLLLRMRSLFISCKSPPKDSVSP